MERSQLFFLVMTVAIVNGIFSPATGIVFILWPVWYPTLILPLSQPFVLFLSSLMVATATLLASGVPAAVWERVTGARDSTAASTGIWLGGAVLLSIPALQRVVQFL